MTTDPAPSAALLTETPSTARMPLGALAPLACAIHCAATPLLVALVPALDPAPAVEWGFLLTSVALAAWALVGGVRVHGRPWVVLPALLGASVWSTSLAAPALGPHHLLAAGGALGVAAALFWNARLRHHACACHAHTCRSRPAAP